MKFRRGFKTEANDVARAIRHELGLRSTDPLDPRRLAAHLEIPITPLSQLKASPAAVYYFTRKKPSEFSAVTVFDGTERLIVFNDSHSPGRQASDLAHELGHALLFHEPTPALDSTGCRDWDQTCEREADWLGAALLISEEAALQIATSGMGFEDAAAFYGVSAPLVRMRVNVTGAHTRVQRSGRYGLRPGRRSAYSTRRT